MEKAAQGPRRVLEPGRVRERRLDDLEIVTAREPVESPGERELRRERQSRERREKCGRPAGASLDPRFAYPLFFFETTTTGGISSLRTSALKSARSLPSTPSKSARIDASFPETSL